MGYCTEQEVREMLKDDVICELIGNVFIEDADEREVKLSPIIINAIEDAEGEVDGYLFKRYSVPLEVVPKTISKFTKDIAVYNLFSRIGIDEGERDKNHLNRYKHAIDFLKMIAEGKIDIGVSADVGTLNLNSGFNVKSNGRLFSRKSMQGM